MEKTVSIGGTRNVLLKLISIDNFQNIALLTLRMIFAFIRELSLDPKYFIGVIEAIIRNHFSAVCRRLRFLWVVINVITCDNNFCGI